MLSHAAANADIRVAVSEEEKAAASEESSIYLIPKLPDCGCQFDPKKPAIPVSFIAGSAPKRIKSAIENAAVAANIAAAAVKRLKQAFFSRLLSRRYIVFSAKGNHAKASYHGFALFICRIVDKFQQLIAALSLFYAEQKFSRDRVFPR